MLAKRLAGILPPLTFSEALETTQVHSVAGLLPKGVGLLAERPFRAPHHSVSDAGLIGGGSGMPRPGEVSLAHNGVLFLDELPEFPRNVLEQLRQPLEEGSVTLARAQMTLSFPAEFHADCRDESMPLRTFFAIPRANAAARGGIIQRYLGKISGPLLDRIDLHIEVPAVPYQELRGQPIGAISADMRARVERVRGVQQRSRVLQLAHSGSPVPQNLRAGRCGRTDSRNGRAPDGALGPRARSDSQSRPHYRRSR